jgi:hypothetical protein
VTLERFRALHPPTATPQDAVLDLLPAAIQVDTANKVLVLAAAAIETGRMYLARPLPLGRWEFRCRDAAWLARTAATL